MPEYTPTEVLLIRVLDDGYAHRREELMDALPDELASRGGLKMHLSRMRKKLRPIGQDVICELHRRQICYRWVRLL